MSFNNLTGIILKRADEDLQDDMNDKMLRLVHTGRETDAASTRRPC